MRDCETCVYARPYRGENDNRCSAWSCEYINRDEAIEVWKASKWRPISEKPDSGQMGKDYLVYTEFGIGIATYFPNDKWSGYDVTGDGFGGNVVLAWMPLPDPWINDMDYVKDGTLTIQARTIKEVNSIDRVIVYADGCQREYLMPLPTIEERKEGMWIDHSNEGYVECPFCGSCTTCEDNIDELHFCFNCGNKLKGE